MCDPGEIISVLLPYQVHFVAYSKKKNEGKMLSMKNSMVLTSSECLTTYNISTEESLVAKQVLNLI